MDQQELIVQRIRSATLELNAALETAYAHKLRVDVTVIPQQQLGESYLRCRVIADVFKPL